MDGVQDGLELTGAFPGIGILPDTVNAMIHVGRGNTNEANWAMAAMLPATGIAATIGKRAKKTAKLVKAAKLTKGPAKGNRVMKGLRKTAKEFMGKGVKDGAVKLIDDTINVSRKKIEKFAEIKPKAPEGGKAPRRKNRFEKPSGTSDGGKGNKTKGNGKGKLTAPTKSKGGKPKGNYEKPRPGKDGKPITRQNRSADLLANEGYDIEMLPETKGGNGYGKKPTSNPDYLIDGEAFDCYSPDGSNIRNIWSTVEQKVEKQAEKIVLNLDDYSGSVDDLYIQFKEWDIGDLKEMLVIKDGNITRWIP